MSMIFTFPGGRLILEAEETVDDSDKTITVPTGKRWRIMWIWVEYTSTATVGNRSISVVYRDSAADIIFRRTVSNLQAASLTRNYLFDPGGSLVTTDAKEVIPLPSNSILDGGYDIRIRDESAIDAAADDMIIQMMILELDL